VLVALAPQLSGDLLARALDAALALQSREDRAEALAALAPQLEGEARATILKQSLVDAWRWGMRMSWRPSPTLEGKPKARALARGLDAALASWAQAYPTGALETFAPQLSSDLLARTLDAVLALEDDWAQAMALASIASQLSGDLLHARWMPPWPFGMSGNRTVPSRRWCRN